MKSTGEDGSTTITDLRPNDYEIYVNKLGYNNETREIRLRREKTKFVLIVLTHRSREIADQLSNWTYYDKALRGVTLNDTAFRVYLLRNESGFIGYLPLTKRGKLPSNVEGFKKVSYAANFVTTSSPNSVKDDAEFFIEMADKFLATQLAGEIVLQIRDTAANLLGQVLSTYASGGASAITKQVGSSTLKQTTKHFAKRFATSLGKNIVEGELDLENAIKSYAKTEIMTSKNSCSKAVNIVQNSHPLDQTWTFREFKSAKNNYQTCAKKLIPSMHLLSDLNPHGDVFTQLQDVSNEVVAGVINVDTDLLVDLLTKSINAANCNGLCKALKDYAGMKTGVQERTESTFLTDREEETIENILSGLKKHGYYTENVFGK